MKKLISYILILSLAFLTICPIGDVEIVRAKTLQDYKNEVAKLETQQSENNRLTTETKNKIRQINIKNFLFMIFLHFKPFYI